MFPPLIVARMPPTDAAILPEEVGVDLFRAEFQSSSSGIPLQDTVMLLAEI